MPEITSENNIRSKLRKFDERMNGAIEAADMFIRFKRDADELEATWIQLKEIENKWNNLQATVNVAVDEAHSAIHDIDKHLDAIEDKLHDENNKLLQKHLAIVKQSSVHAVHIADDRETSREFVRTAKSILSTFQAEFHAEINKYIHKKLTSIENDIETKQTSIYNKLKEQTYNLEKELHEKIADLKEELTTKLNNHQLKTDQRITDFLTKQNVLIQNLSQQIDGFYRSTKTILAEQQAIKKQVNDFETKLENITQKQNEKDDKTDTFENNLLKVTERFNMTIKQLQRTRFIGKSFNEI